jgi:hypothetical protein
MPRERAERPAADCRNPQSSRPCYRISAWKPVDFGAGEHVVAAQVAMLEGVGLVLSAHGAALTNLAYLQPELKVVEIIGAHTRTACFMHLASMLGFRYHGIFASECDDQSDIVVDLDELRDALCALTSS